MPFTLPGNRLWEYNTPATVALSPIVTPFIETTGFTNMLLSYVFTNSTGTTTLTVEGSFDGSTQDTDVTYPALPALVPAQPAVAASTVAVQNLNLYPVQVVISAGTITAVVVNGVTVGTAAGTYVVPPQGAISVTYSVAPTWVWSALPAFLAAVVPVVTPYVRFRVVQATADATRTKIFVQARQ